MRNSSAFTGNAADLVRKLFKDSGVHYTYPEWFDRNPLESATHGMRFLNRVNKRCAGIEPGIKKTDGRIFGERVRKRFYEIDAQKASTKQKGIMRRKPAATIPGLEEFRKRVEKRGHKWRRRLTNSRFNGRFIRGSERT